MISTSEDTLDVVIGQIEQELAGIKSAKEQLDDLVATHQELSNSHAEIAAHLNELMASVTKIKEWSDQTIRDAVGSMREKVDAVNDCTQFSEDVKNQAEQIAALNDQLTGIDERLTSLAKHLENTDKAVASMESKISSMESLLAPDGELMTMLSRIDRNAQKGPFQAKEH